MLNKDLTVNSRKKDNSIFLNTEILKSIEYGEPDINEVKSYVEILEEFVCTEKNIGHRYYYEASRHLDICTSFLEANTEIEKEESKGKKNDFFSRKPTISEAELDQKLITLIEEKNYSEDELTIILNFIAKEASIHPLELRKVYEAKKITLEKKQFRTETTLELNRLIKLENSRLDISRFLPEQIGKNTIEFCEELGLKPEAALLAILSTFSSCYPLSTQICLRRSSSFYQHGNLYAAFVAPPGSNKSAIYKIFCANALKIIQQEFEKEFKRKTTEYDELEQIYKNADRDTRQSEFPQGLPPKPEKSNRAYLTQSTVEAYATYFSLYPEKRILMLSEELKRLFDSMNAYKGGNGGDEQAYLEMYDCGPISSGRVKVEANYYIEQTCLSIFGTTQPEKLKELWGDGTDSDGMYSRFLYVFQKNNRFEWELEDKDFDSPIVKNLSDFYFWAKSLKPFNYNLSEAAFRRFALFANHMNHLGSTCPISFLQHAYHKSIGHCGRLALNLHIMNAYNGTLISAVPEVVEEHTIYKAIDLVKFFLGQTEYLYKDLCDQEGLSPILKSILELSKQLGWISAREVKMNRRKLRNVDPEIIRQSFLDLKDMAKGEVRGSGSRLQFCLGDNNDNSFDNSNSTTFNS